jgi:hypothetical protein
MQIVQPLGCMPCMRVYVWSYVYYYMSVVCEYTHLSIYKYMYVHSCILM